MCEPVFFKTVAQFARELFRWDGSGCGKIVLDAFLGSGTTVIAAERTGRRCYGLELPLMTSPARRRPPILPRSRGAAQNSSCL
jgi:hypothetical protein